MTRRMGGIVAQRRLPVDEHAAARLKFKMVPKTRFSHSFRACAKGMSVPDPCAINTNVKIHRGIEGQEHYRRDNRS